jgi:signal transduction histidine kinase
MDEVLDLPFVNKIVNALGGDIGLKSKYQIGTEFMFNIK